MSSFLTSFASLKKYRQRQVRFALHD